MTRKDDHINHRRSSNSDDKIIGENIRKYRNKAGMTLKDLSDKVGVTYQQLQKYETGSNRVTAATICHIAKALDIRVTRLLNGVIQ